MGGDDNTTVQYPAMPSYGEGMEKALQVQLAMTTGQKVGDYDFSEVLPRGMESIVEAERPGRLTAAQLEADVLRRQILGDQMRAQTVTQADVDAGRATADQLGQGYFAAPNTVTSEQFGGGSTQTPGGRYQVVSTGVGRGLGQLDATRQFGLYDTKEGRMVDLQEELVKTGHMTGQTIQNDKRQYKLSPKGVEIGLGDQYYLDEWSQPGQSFDMNEAAVKAVLDDLSGKIESGEINESESTPLSTIDPRTGRTIKPGEIARDGTGLIDLYGPKDIAQYATEQDVAAGAAENVGDFLGYRQAGIASEADVAAGRAGNVGEFMGLAPAMQQGMEYMAASQREADIRDVERLGQRATEAYRDQGGIRDALSRISGLAGQTAPTTLQSYSGPTYTPPTEYSPVSVNEYADPLTAAAMDRRAAMIADRETAQNITLPEAPEFSFEQRAPDLVEPQQRTVARDPVDAMERRYDYGQRVRPVKNLNDPNDQGQLVNAGPTTLQGLSSQMGASLDPIRSRLFNQAVSGLETGLTDRERRNVEQASRLATGARGRLRDFGSTVKEVQDVMAEDRNRLNQNRAFAQSVLGGEQALQQRELAAAEADIARAAQRQAGDRGFALQALGAEQATSADPFMSILGRPSGAAAGAAQGLLAAGQQNNAMAGPQFINPESGLSYISQMAANKANMFGAQQQANAARSAGTMGMLGSLGGGLLGGVFK